MKAHAHLPLKKEHLEVLKWAWENECTWDANTCANAAKGGQLEVLKWMGSGEPFSYYVVYRVKVVQIDMYRSRTNSLIAKVLFSFKRVPVPRGCHAAHAQVRSAAANGELEVL